MLTATDSYLNAVRDLDRSLSIVSRSPLVARETEYYLANITNVKSVADFTSNRRLLRYALTAHGLSEFNNATAFVRKLLEGGIDDTKALANRLSDQRFRDFVSAFNFARYGPTATTFDRTQKGTAALYARQALEENTGAQNEGARLALYFRRKAERVTSPLNILADAALLKVVQTATGLTPLMSNLSIDAQIEMISSKIDVVDFKTPAKLDKFLSRFTALWDLDHQSSAFSNLLPLAFASPTLSISADLITAIQRVKTRL